MAESVSVREAVQQLFEMDADDVYRYAVSILGRSVEAEDVVQEVFVRVFRHWYRFRHDASVKTWLFAITRNCIQDSYRKHHRRKEYLTEAGTVPDSPEPWIDESLLELEDTLKDLSASYRQVVALRFIHDLSTEDTAKVLGWSTAKVRTTLHRAVHSLRKGLYPDGTVRVGRRQKEREPHGV